MLPPEVTLAGAIMNAYCTNVAPVDVGIRASVGHWVV
jgi:hypothetical protein